MFTTFKHSWNVLNVQTLAWPSHEKHCRFYKVIPSQTWHSAMFLDVIMCLWCRTTWCIFRHVSFWHCTTIHHANCVVTFRCALIGEWVQTFGYFDIYYGTKLLPHAYTIVFTPWYLKEYYSTMSHMQKTN